MIDVGDQPLSKAEDGGSTPPVRTEPIGVSGLEYSGGEIRDEILDDLRGVKGVKTYTRMGHDAIAGAGLKVMRRMIRQTAWPVVATDATDPEAVAGKTFLEQNLDDMRPKWKGTLGEILTMPQYGWAAMEPVYKYRRGADAARPENKSQYDDGLTGWQSIEPRSQDSLNRWDWDERGHVAAMVQLDPNQGSEYVIPIADLFLFSLEATKTNPEGMSVLRSAYESWYYRTGARRMEGIVLERMGGFPKVYMPAEYMLPDAPSGHKAIADGMNRGAKQFRINRQTHWTIPYMLDEKGNKMFDMVIEQSKASPADFDKVIQRYGKEMAISMLTDVLLLGHEKVGSFALADAKTDLLGYSLAAIMDEIADVMNEQAIPELFGRNPQFPRDKWPTLTHGDIETPALGPLGTYVQALQSVGVDLSDEETQQKLRAVADLPQTQRSAA